MTAEEFHQQQLEQQQMLSIENLNSIAYRCLGVAQSIKDCRELGITGPLVHIEKRLIELATEFETIKRSSK